MYAHGEACRPDKDRADSGAYWLALEGSVGSLGHIGGAVHPVRDGRPGIFRYGLDEIVQAFVLADGDGEAQA